MKLFRIFKEIKNYFYLIRTIRKNRNSEVWKKHNLRYNWFFTIYTVVNLPPEVFGSEEIYYQTYVMEALLPIYEYFITLNIQEIIECKTRRIEGNPSFLVLYKPLFNDLTAWWIFKWTVFISGVYYLQMRFDLINVLHDLISKF